MTKRKKKKSNKAHVYSDDEELLEIKMGAMSIEEATMKSRLQTRTKSHSSLIVIPGVTKGKSKFQSVAVEIVGKQPLIIR